MSRCRFCSARMVRLAPGDWRLASADEEAHVMRTGRLPAIESQSAA